MRKISIVFISLLLFLFTLRASAFDTTLVKSPNGSIVFKLFQKNSQLYYAIDFLGEAIIAPSPMIMMVNGIPVTKNIKITRTENYSRNRSYPIMGAHAKADDQCNGVLVYIKSGAKVSQTSLDIRVFNDGAAFRHRVVSRGMKLTPEESTIFTLPAGCAIWYHDLYMHYEGVHTKKQIEEVPEGDWLAPPATFKLPQGVYASITEAELTAYPGMALQANGKNGLVLRLANDQPTSYPYKLRYSPEDTLRLKQDQRIYDSVITPWRVVIIGSDLNALVNNDIITNLNPSPDPALFPQGIHTEWIKPGRAVWKYLNGGGKGTLEVMKHFTDGAAALGFEHNILEGFWSRWTDEQLQELVNYSNQKGVGIWLWKHSKNLRTAAARDSFFRKYSAMGVTGAKIDFFDSEAKEVIDLYESILKESAKYHMLVDFHGANKPTGLSRTYPNELTVEAVKGMESSKLADRATHETTIPFTRLIAGPAEYTVLHFGDRRKNTTWAHQIASCAILSAPLLTYAANPDTILLNPAVNIIKSIPPVWDETIVLPPSEIGELAIYARRKGSTWFLAIMNGVQAKRISVPLHFLKGNYKAAIAKDDPANPAAVDIDQKTYSSNDTLQLDLISGGGFIAKFSKE